MLQKIFFLLNFLIISNILLAQQIIVPKNDNRKYKSITLKNGIQAILVSDKNAQNAAAAIDVGVGSFENPINMEGLAHFLEHMLFLGNKKYPKTNEFSEFLSQHGGSNNAYTSGKNTNYHFQVQYKHLEESLGRLAEFFISPTFSKEYIEKEIQAVHSEYQKNLLSETRRGFAVLKKLSNSDHPFSKFHTGNLQTLSTLPKIRRQVILFYEKYYIPDLMKIAVLGRENLKELESLVREKFEKIPVKKGKFKIPIQRYSGRVYKKEKTPTFVQIQSLKNIRKLNFVFEIDSTKKRYQQKATYYIASILGDEQKGSILSYLKKSGWAVSLSAGVSLEHINTDFFSIDIELTKEGEKNIEQIIRVVFDYIQLIKTKGVKKWRFEEMKQIAELNFHSNDIITADVLVKFLSSQARYFSPKDILYANWKFGKFSKKAINKMIAQMNVDNLKIIYTSSNNIPLAKKEKWYDTSYKVHDISPNNEFYWKQDSKINKELSLPPKNSYLLTKKPIILTSKDEGLLTKLPLKASTYYTKSTSFQVPKVRLYIDILTPFAYQNPKNSSFTRIYAKLIKDQLAEKLYPAYLLGFQFDIRSGTKGLHLVLEGYPEKMEFFSLQILAIIKNTNFEKKRFLLIRQKTIEEWENLNLTPAYRIANYEYQQLTRKKFWYYKDYLKILKSASFDELQEFQKQFFQSIKLEFFIYGNIEKEKAAKLAKKIIKTLNTPSQVKKKPKENFISLPNKANYYIQKQVKDINSAIFSSYQVTEQNKNTEVKMQLLANFISPRFYNFIRTNQQLGYLVWSYYTGVRQSNSLVFIIQSAVAPPFELQNYINNFLIKLEKELEELTKENFQKLKIGLQQVYTQQAENFLESSNFYYHSIQQKDYDLIRKKLLQQELQKVKKTDLQSLYKELFLSRDSKLLAIHILGKDIDKQKHIANSKEITNREIFKQKQTYIPIP